MVLWETPSASPDGRFVEGRDGRAVIDPTTLEILLESLEETVAVLGDSDAVAELVDAHHAYLDGDVVSGVDAVGALRPR